MDDPAKKPDSETPAAGPLISSLLSARLSRRQMLKVSLIGAGGLAAAVGGLGQLKQVFAAVPSSLGRWLPLAPKTAPSPRAGAAMAYDGGRRLTVLFGGFSGAKVDAETWTWNGLTWTRHNHPLSPPPRSGASIAYHPRSNAVVLFGGQSASGAFLGDTWMWNGRTWTAVRGGGPPARHGACMAIDPATGSLILVGGFTPANFLNDTWRWDGKSWRALAPASSPPRVTGASLAYSPIIGKLILFGGRRGMGVPESGTTWAWDGTNWSYVPLSPAPRPRAFASMAAAPDGPILLFGGLSNRSLLSDTWTLTSTWSQDSQTPGPPPRAYAPLVSDSSANSLLLFGGQSDSDLLGDTWVWA